MCVKPNPLVPLEKGWASTDGSSLPSPLQSVRVLKFQSVLPDHLRTKYQWEYFFGDVECLKHRFFKWLTSSLVSLGSRNFGVSGLERVVYSRAIEEDSVFLSRTAANATKF